MNDCIEAANACACFNVRRTARLVTQVYDDALAGVGVSSGQFVVLLSTRILGESTMQELAEAVSLDRSALSRALQPLIRRNLVQMTVGKDRRTRRIALTVEGLQLLKDGAPFWMAAQERMQAALGQDGFSELLSTSRRSFEQLAK